MKIAATVKKTTTHCDNCGFGVAKPAGPQRACFTGEHGRTKHGKKSGAASIPAKLRHTALVDFYRRGLVECVPMNSSDTYRKYAADCIGLAKREDSPEAKNIMVNMALAWIRLAQQKQAMTPAPAIEADVPEVLVETDDAAAKARAH